MSDRLNSVGKWWLPRYPVHMSPQMLAAQCSRARAPLAVGLTYELLVGAYGADSNPSERVRRIRYPRSAPFQPAPPSA
jgi:hypothetical protein